MTQPKGGAVDTVILDGLALAQQIRGEIADEVQSLIENGGRAPCLAVVLVGEEVTLAEFVSGFGSFGGQIIETNLDEKDIKALRKALKHSR